MNNLDIKERTLLYPNLDMQSLTQTKRDRVENELNFARAFITEKSNQNKMSLSILIDTLAPVELKSISVNDARNIKEIVLNEKVMDYEIKDNLVQFKNNNYFKHSSYNQKNLAPLRLDFKTEASIKIKEIEIENLFSKEKVRIEKWHSLPLIKDSYQILKERTYSAGEYKFNKSLIIPKDGKIRIIGKVTFFMEEATTIESFAPIDISKGVLHIKPLKNRWGSISFHKINGNLQNLSLSGTSSSYGKYGYYDCGLCLYESKVKLKKINLNDSHNEDALYAIKSEVFLESSQINNSLSDAFDCDFCNLQIRDLKIVKSLGDGVDLSGTNFEIINLEALFCDDKGISIGEESRGTLTSSYLANNNLGIAIKDGSDVVLSKVSYFNNKKNLDLYIKKNIYSAPRVSYE